MNLLYTDPDMEAQDDIDDIDESDDILDEIDYDAQAQDEDDDESSDEDDKIILSKHSQNGKHSLSYDVIFKGKVSNNEYSELEELSFIEEDLEDSYNQKFSVNNSTIYWDESMNNEEYVRQLRIKDKIYTVLKENTTIKFDAKIRRPSKVDFNKYYYLLKSSLKGEMFSNTELFVELSSYFTRDNLFNMFKLLDNKWKNDIIAELQVHIGKVHDDKTISKRNLQPDTQIIFKYEDKDINGIIIEADSDADVYLVDSYLKLYEIKMSDIVKITMSHKKFKYNLNKLNNIDFL